MFNWLFAVLCRGAADGRSALGRMLSMQNRQLLACRELKQQQLERREQLEAELLKTKQFEQTKRAAIAVAARLDSQRSVAKRQRMSAGGAGQFSVDLDMLQLPKLDFSDSMTSARSTDTDDDFLLEDS